MPNKLTWLVLASIAAIAVVGVASAQAPQPFPGRQIPGQRTFTCPPTVSAVWMPGTRPDGWRQFFETGYLDRAFYDQALHRVMCHYRHVNPDNRFIFTQLEWRLDTGLQDCTVTTDGKAVVCNPKLKLAPRRP